MDKYEVLSLLGEGSFGRVYKAKQNSDSTIVALKVISKRRRSLKEIKGLRRECEIQRHLHHPNIIQMLDSFETDNEIVVITEFAHKQLNVVLSKEGYFPEERVQRIVGDLVSALYYLHSHRVLHRDLKPQNILLDSKNKAKLCDFGFARNMSTGTHVLTSIKGTPLYMAPELIEEHPYDHTADLWSLGCIIYELLVGAPPFCTTSIIHLINMIRHEEIQWPIFTSDICVSFLKGLLNKDPIKRLSWPEILEHQFMKGHMLVIEDVPSKPLTRPLSIDTLHAKEKQRKDVLIQKAKTKLSSSKSIELASSPATGAIKRCSKNSKTESTSKNTKSSSNTDNDSAELSQKVASLNIDADLEVQEHSEKYESDDKINNNPSGSSSSECLKRMQESLNLDEDSSPIENEEWIVFLQRTIEEVVGGEMGSLTQSSLANIAISPLRNPNTSPKVLIHVATLFSLPLIVPCTSEDVLEQLKKVYFEIKLVPNLINASKLLLKRKNNGRTEWWLTSDFVDEDLLAIERIYVLTCHLIYLEDKFLSQFCDSLMILNIQSNLHGFLILSKHRLRIVTDLLAILTHLLRKSPENSELVNQIIFKSNDEAKQPESINFINLLRHCDPLLRERTCYFLQFLCKSTPKSMEMVWSDCMRETLEALVYDSVESVRNVAEITVDELRRCSFYEGISTGTGASSDN